MHLPVVCRKVHLPYERKQTFILSYPQEFADGNQLLGHHARSELCIQPLLGNLTQITHVSGTGIFAYIPTENWKADALRQRHCLQASPSGYDELGRLDGFKLSADDRRVQKTHLSYDGEGHLSTLTAECMEKLSFGPTSKERKRTGSTSRSKT